MSSTYRIRVYAYCVDTQDEEEDEGDEEGEAQLAELPEGLRELAGEVRELVVRSSRLAVVPGWVGELTRLEALEVSVDVYYTIHNCYQEPKLRAQVAVNTLPASLGQLGSLKQLTLARLGGLEVLPDALVRLTSLSRLTIGYCGKLRALPRGIGKLGALKQLTVRSTRLAVVPVWVGELTRLEALEIKIGRAHV